MKVSIKKLIVSQNKRDRSHWAKHYRDKRDWGYALLLALRCKLIPPNRQVHVKITCYRPRLLDDANMVGGAKGLVDAIVDMGIAKDDSREWIKVEYEQVKVPKAEQRTEIEWSHED